MLPLPGKILASLCLGLGLLAACQAEPAQPASAKIDPQVSAAAQALSHGGSTRARTDAQGRLLVYIYVTDTGADTLRRLAAAGLIGAQTNQETTIVQGWIAPAALKPLAGLSCVKVITLPRYAVPR
jgi:hypothetical protein